MYAAGKTAASQALILVLDTNVVLDWLLFADPRVAGVAAAVTSLRARWLATPEMRAELAQVLARGVGARIGPVPGEVLEGFDRWAEMADPTIAVAAPAALRCADADDQMFIDLALGARASALLSRDRAVLRLARAAAAYGIAIGEPGRWHG